ncbi:MAG: anthranilate phosphoribosyltransferase [Gemmatimonadota bacterium]
MEPGIDPRPAAGDPHACLVAITDGAVLTAVEAEALFGAIMDGRVSAVVIGALLAALRTRGETVAEIAGAARGMRARAARVETARDPLVDTCGTGGDFSGSFNISTTAAFVAAAAGAAIAKHGNRAASSRCGSADVLEAAGAAIDLPPDAVGRVLDATGIGFCFAPRFHPAMRHASGARRELGIPTVFNLLGPLTNPAGARRQVIGVPSLAAVDLMAAVLAELGTEHALVVHGHEGLDEISVAGPTTIAEVRDSTVTRQVVTPAALGLAPQAGTALAGGDAATNARILRAVLEGRGTAAQSASVAANAGAALWVASLAPTLRDGVTRAADLIRSADAAPVLDAFIDATRAESAALPRS